MGKYRNGIIAALAIAAVLVGMWFVGGTGEKGVVPSVPSVEISTDAAAVVSAEAAAPVSENVEETLALSESAEPSESTEPLQEATPTPTPTPVPKQAINPETGKDAFLTDPVPQGKPLPVEPQDAVIGDGSFTCTLSVRCDTLLANMDALDAEKHELVPADGVILPATTVTVYEGESVFHVLQREMRRNQIHMEFVNTPIYNSAYIEGIHNLYEFDGGNLSGWMYKVNGWFPNYGCSRYVLKPGDVVEWVYTCDLGRDVGGGAAAGGGQRDE